MATTPDPQLHVEVENTVLTPTEESAMPKLCQAQIC